MQSKFRLGHLKPYNRFIHNGRTNTTHFVSNVDKLLSLLHPLEDIFTLKYDKHFSLIVTKEEQQAFRVYMEQQGVDFTKPVILCTVAARLKHKIWNTERMAAVLLTIVNKYNAQLIFNFAGEEKIIADEVFQKMDASSNVFLNVEAKSVRELAAMTKNTDFFFGNEGGPRHIAQALDVPSFAIYPPGTSMNEWLPNPSERNNGVHPSSVCSKQELANLPNNEAFDKITVDVVLSELLPILDKFFK